MMPSPLKMLGKEIKTILLLMDAIKVPWRVSKKVPEDGTIDE